MRLMVIILIFSICDFSYAEDNWIKRITLAARESQPVEKIQENDFFEVSASKKDAAELMLKDSSVIPENQNDIEYFGQKNFSCKNTYKPYLIRAIYSNGGTGRFQIKRYGSSLLVSHASLGSASSIQKTALIICLDFQPTEIFTQSSGAM